MGKRKGNFMKIPTLTAMKRWDRFPDWVRFGETRGKEKLTISLVGISSLLDPRRHRSGGGGHHSGITGRLLEGGN